ncbi:MAG: type I 3-dehydroquinate dehydratase [archaeon]|jgi:3-dehydroquinate dehydratase type I|nr:type I 3-dehydroquinate dehydratase [archaeon]
MTGPKVCVSLDGTTVKAMADEAARANLAGADMVEVRFDRLYLKKPEPVEVEDEEGEIKRVMAPEEEWPVREESEVDVDEAIAALKESIPLPVVFTVRPSEEGGYFPGDEKARIAILEKAIASGVSRIDLELSIDEKQRSALLAKAGEANVSVISSIHNTTTTPSAEELIKMVEEHAQEGQVFKFCGTVNDHQDALQIVEASYELRNSKHAFSMMALGNGGDWTRLHAPILGQDLVYATLRSEYKLSNKGLVNVRDLKNAWTLLEY